MIIREITADDAKDLLDLYRLLDQETSFLLFDSGERDMLVDVQKTKVLQIIKDPAMTVLAAVADKKLIGFITIRGNIQKRIKHRASLSIGVLKENQGQGNGKLLMQKAEEWAKQRDITRLELTVMTSNRQALWLFSTQGFNVEGIRRHAVVVDGQNVDEFYMCKMLHE